jgi:hypothetical protein
MEASALVLMKREDGILTSELGSYEIESGIELVYKAYVENNRVKLFLTTDRDVEDTEYNEIYDNYDEETLSSKGYKVEEVDDEYNPVWCISFKYEEDYKQMEDTLNEIIGHHEDELKRIYEEIQK